MRSSAVAEGDNESNMARARDRRELAVHLRTARDKLKQGRVQPVAALRATMDYAPLP